MRIKYIYYKYVYTVLSQTCLLAFITLTKGSESKIFHEFPKIHENFSDFCINRIF